jgi:hypothetical protein
VLSYKFRVKLKVFTNQQSHHLPEDEVQSVEVSELTSFLLLNQLLENADIFRRRDFNSEDLSFWIIIEKQAVEREYRH